MGKVTVVGGKVGMKKPVAGILASDLAVGSSVYLIENNSPVEYLVVNQGIPSGSSLYDSSCDGTWLLRKDICPTFEAWNTKNNDYENGVFHRWVSVDYLSTLSYADQCAIRKVKIPYQKGVASDNVISSGANGLSTRAFFPSIRELGLTDSPFSDSFPFDGAKLNYFSDNSSRIAYLNGTATYYNTRSSRTSGKDYIWTISQYGSHDNGQIGSQIQGRPMLIIDYNTKLDENTMTIKDMAIGVFTFTINSVSYQAEPNMTWAQWVNSSYNTGGIYISNYGYVMVDSTYAVSGCRYITSNDIVGVVDYSTMMFE